MFIFSVLELVVHSTIDDKMSDVSEHSNYYTGSTFALSVIIILTHQFHCCLYIYMYKSFDISVAITAKKVFWLIAKAFKIHNVLTCSTIHSIILNSHCHIMGYFDNTLSRLLRPVSKAEVRACVKLLRRSILYACACNLWTWILQWRKARDFWNYVQKVIEISNFVV